MQILAFGNMRQGLRKPSSTTRERGAKMSRREVVNVLSEELQHAFLLCAQEAPIRVKHRQYPTAIRQDACDHLPLPRVGLFGFGIIAVFTVWPVFVEDSLICRQYGLDSIAQVPARFVFHNAKHLAQAIYMIPLPVGDKLVRIRGWCLVDLSMTRGAQQNKIVVVTSFLRLKNDVGARPIIGGRNDVRDFRYVNIHAPHIEEEFPRAVAPLTIAARIGKKAELRVVVGRRFSS
jgi:hypothetical protein